MYIVNNGVMEVFVTTGRFLQIQKRGPPCSYIPMHFGCIQAGLLRLKVHLSFYHAPTSKPGQPRDELGLPQDNFLFITKLLKITAQYNNEDKMFFVYNRQVSVDKGTQSGRFSHPIYIRCL